MVIFFKVSRYLFFHPGFIFQLPQDQLQGGNSQQQKKLAKSLRASFRPWSSWCLGDYFSRGEMWVFWGFWGWVSFVSVWRCGVKSHAQLTLGVYYRDLWTTYIINGGDDPPSTGRIIPIYHQVRVGCGYSNEDLSTKRWRNMKLSLTTWVNVGAHRWTSLKYTQNS